MTMLYPFVLRRERSAGYISAEGLIVSDLFRSAERKAGAFLVRGSHFVENAADRLGMWLGE